MRRVRRNVLVTIGACATGGCSPEAMDDIGHLGAMQVFFAVSATCQYPVHKYQILCGNERDPSWEYSALFTELSFAAERQFQ